MAESLGRQKKAGAQRLPRNISLGRPLFNGVAKKRKSNQAKLLHSKEPTPFPSPKKNGVRRRISNQLPLDETASVIQLISAKICELEKKGDADGVTVLKMLSETAENIQLSKFDNVSRAISIALEAGKRAALKSALEAGGRKFSSYIFFADVLPKIANDSNYNSTIFEINLGTFLNIVNEHSSDAWDILKLWREQNSAILQGTLASIEIIRESTNPVFKLMFHEGKTLYAKKSDVSPEILAHKLIPFAGIRALNVEQIGKWGLSFEVAGVKASKTEIDQHDAEQFGRVLACAWVFGLVDTHPNNIILSEKEKTVCLIDNEMCLFFPAGYSYLLAENLFPLLESAILPISEYESGMHTGFLAAFASIREHEAECLSITKDAINSKTRVGVDDLDHGRRAITEADYEKLRSNINTNPDEAFSALWSQLLRIKDDRDKIHAKLG
ncbi:MAG: hypothetical protein ABIH99_01310 [Candidatus Micrarchaeota archaeon]